MIIKLIIAALCVAAIVIGSAIINKFKNYE